MDKIQPQPSPDKSNIVHQHVRRAIGPESPTRIVPVFTRMGIIDTKGPYKFGLHQHPDYEVILVDRGLYRAQLNAESVTLKRDELLVVKPGDWHSDVCEVGLRFFGVGFYFDPRWFEAQPPNLFGPQTSPRDQAVKVDRAAIWPILRRIQAEGLHSDRSAPHIQDALLMEFFWRMVRAFSDEVLSDRFLMLTQDQSFPNQLNRLFSEHVRGNLDIGHMASQLHMSRRTLSHKCRQLLGTSPSRAFLKCKLEHARHLLKNSSNSIKEVALQFGFADQYHFSKCFKREFGAAPSKGR